MKFCFREERMTKKILLSMLLVWFTLLGFASLSGCGATQTPTPRAGRTPEPTQAPLIFSLDIDEPASAARLSDERPNIILIVTDDQPYFTLEYMPFLKNEFIPASVNFERGFVTTPLCCPSRATILNGEYVHNHKVYTNEWPTGGAQKFDDTATIGTWLQEVGYRTAYYGKYLNGYNDMQPYGYVPPGWDDWRVKLGRKPEGFGYFFDFSLSENGVEVEYPRSHANYSADVITRHSLEFIAENKDQPFFLLASYYNPHSPYIAAPRHRETFRSGTGWEWEPHRPPNFNPKDLRDKPKYIQELKQTPPDVLDTANLQMLRSLLSVDDGVASILNILRQTRLEQNTIVLFLSDNGMTVGEHGFGVDKNCPYDECARVPFIVYAPGRYAPRVDANLVANIDLVPTFLDLAGYSGMPERVNGLSLLPLLENPSQPWRDEILLEHWPAIEGVGELIPQFYAVRTHEWKYVEYETGECELYDLINDPYELKNLCNQKKHTEIQADLKIRLERLKQE
jgi:N-acetylglucosamine-6-sulfatase